MERDPELVHECVFEPRVVHLRRGHPDLVQRSAVQRPPLPVDAQDLAGQHQVGVQVGVTGAAGAVIERRGDQAVGVDLRDTTGAGAGEAGLPLDVGEGFLPRLPVRFLDLFTHLVTRHRPQCRHRLGRRERQVIPRHRLPFRAALAGEELRDRRGVPRRRRPAHVQQRRPGRGQPQRAAFRFGRAAAVLFPEQRQRRHVRLRVRRRALGEGGVRPTQRDRAQDVGVRVVTLTPQALHLIVPDNPAHTEVAATLTGPDPRRFTRRRVIRRQVLALRQVLIGDRHLARQVVIPIPGAHLVDGHRHARSVAVPALGSLVVQEV